MFVFTRLPVELVDEIARYSTPCELQALCLVSKQIGDVATRRLYHTIVLESLKNAIRCFSTLAQRQEVASCVRRMAIGVLPIHIFRNFYQLAAAALKCTTNLVGLDISGLNHLLSLLAKTSFPRLAEAKLPYAPSLTTFLQTNRQLLKAIIIEGSAVTPDLLSSSSRHFTNVQLPELQAFVGSCNIIPHVIPGSQVQYLTICWEPECERLEEIMRCVAQSRRGVLGMDNLVLGWNPALLNVIADFMPRIERLRIRNVCPLSNGEMIESYMLYLEEGLHKFEQLHTLAITLLFNPYEYHLEDLDHEYDLLRRWGSLVPTLMVCTLPSMTRWMRVRESHWFPFVDPKDDPYKKLKVHWLFRGFKNGTYPKELFAMISGGINFEDVEPLVHIDDYLEDEEDDFGEDGDGQEEEADSGWDWEDGGPGGVDWHEGDSDETSDWEDTDEDGDLDWVDGNTVD